jgi:hypothetical protein
MQIALKGGTVPMYAATARKAERLGANAGVDKANILASPQQQTMSAVYSFAREAMRRCSATRMGQQPTS